MSNYVTKTNVLSALARFKENTDALYETKADANEMKSEINQHESRLQNLEQKAGDYSIVQYRGTNAVPTGKAKYGLAKSIVGKTRAWNQLYDIESQPQILVATQGITVTRSTHSLIIDGESTQAIYLSMPSSFLFKQGHKYLFIMNGWSSSKCYITDQSGQNCFGPNAKLYQNTVVEVQGSGADPRFTIPANRSFSNEEISLNCYDLTLIFGAGNEPSTVAEAISLLPALGQYNAYDAGSLVDTVVSGAKSVGVNIWDEEWEVGAYNTTTGEKRALADRIRSANSYSVNANTEYYFLVPYSSTISGFAVILFYDANGGYLSYTNVSSNGDLFTTPPNCATITFFVSANYGLVYKHDIQFCLNSLPDAIKTTYHPYKTDTLSLSETVTLKSAGSVAEVLTLETGKKTRPIGSVDMSSLQWGTAGAYRYTASLASSIKKVASNNDVGNILAGKYTTKARSGIDDTNDIAVDVDGYIFVRTTETPSGNLNYELATPDPDEQVCDPIPDNTILTEGGGTVETIQTQTPVIDNCLDVGYLAV